MVGAKRLLVDRQRPNPKLLGLFVLAQIVELERKLAETPRYQWVVGAKHPQVDRQYALAERDCFGVPTGLVQLDHLESELPGPFEPLVVRRCLCESGIDRDSGHAGLGWSRLQPQK